MKRLVHCPRLLTHTALVLLMLAIAGPAYATGPTATPGTLSTGGAPAPLTPPAVALQAIGAPGSGVHALGFVPNPAAPRVAQVSPFVALPATVDLSQYVPPVGDQEGVSSCVSWATGYYLRGWYAKRDGYYPAGGGGNTGSYAPMYLYSQLAHGRNVGTYFNDNLNILQGQGIDTRADYTQGDYDYTDLPTAGETANASHIRIASYSDVAGPNLQNWIQSTMASGNPVVLGLPIYPEFDHASASNPLVGLPQPGETSRGGHAVFAVGYDANGVWIENSWGTSYGLNGWAELSWAFVNQYVYEGVSEVPLLPGNTVPNVIGETTTAAYNAIHAAGFVVATGTAVDRTCNDINRIMRQSPSGGTWAVYNSTVAVTIGSRPPTPCP
jgi:hypothetical protein